MMRVNEIRTAGTTTPVNLSVLFHSVTNNIVPFGKKRKKAPEFMAAIKAGVGLASGFNIPDLFPTWTGILAKVTGMKRSLQGIYTTVDAILEEIIAERKGIRDEKIRAGADNVDENLVDVLIGLQEKGGFGFHLDNSKFKAIILDMFAGGMGTSVSAMEWGMLELMRNPSATVTEADMQAGLKMVMGEALRLHPPAPLLVPRESIDVCEIDGYTIPAKSRVIINAWAIGRDLKYWDSVEEFKPERFEDGTLDFKGSNYEFILFGSGRRMCPGFNYGLASMKLISWVFSTTSTGRSRRV
uniref:Cytochrome P450 n=1 Tax=Oryza punctata TaxID=4537 RepID=A0A0E0LZ50_ORYPU